MDVRASRTISAEQVDQLERLVFAGGEPSADQLDLLFLMDTYLARSGPRWAALLERAAHSKTGETRLALWKHAKAG